ncbi:MAG TPA: PQQ-binding-like beta-propeller repeat protein [Gemmataceae bacterium]|jgi:outer membrane protein assembly factor BamB|nr:PQQ-binding-like beta-propeller repeat protein [Gemmataceae bacterium]
MLRASYMSAAFIALFVASAKAENWPSWRGPTGEGYSEDKAPPLKWSAKENVRWKVPLPEAGNSSPVVLGERVFVTQASDKGTKRGLMCFNRTDGKLLWHKFVEFATKEPTHDTNPFCSATPVTDGERVIASYGSAGMACYDLDGKELWKKDTGPQVHIWGTASSPIIYGDLAILWIGPGERQILLAVDKKTGEKVWEHNEPGGASGLDGDSKNWIGSWSTPIVAKVGDHDELILTMPKMVRAFDPKTGKQLWWCDGLTNLVYTSPVISKDGIVVALSGFHGSALAVRAGGQGDVTKTHRLWHHTQQNPQRIGSGVIVGDYFYLLNEQGLAQCLELRTGKDLWDKERVSSPSWSSFVEAAGRLYVTTMSGETLVLRADPKLEVLAKNPIGERVLASLAISEGEIFIRGHKNLWCISEKK